MSQSVNIASTIPDSYRLSSCLLNIARLPSAATYDWTTQAAGALAPLIPARTDARIGVVIAKIDHDSARFIPESAGVSLTDLTGSEADPHFQTECSRARSPLDRIGSAGYTLSENHLQSGFVTNTQSLLPHWYASPLTSPWNTGRSLIACAPLDALGQDHKTTREHSIPTHALLVLLGTDEQTLLIDPVIFGAALRMPYPPSTKHRPLSQRWLYPLAHPARTTHPRSSHHRRLSPRDRRINWPITPHRP